MKKIKIGLLMAALVVCLLMAVGCFEVSEGLEYAPTEDGSAYVVIGSGSCTDEHLRIPSTYDGKPVVGIADEAFLKCANIERVDIPAGVTSIGESAFSWCSGLTRVDIPDGVTVVGDQAFAHCKGLTEVSLPDSVQAIGDSAFADCVALPQLHIPANVTSIGIGVCYGCTAMTDITVAAGNPAYRAVGSCLIETASGTLIAGCKDSVMPSDGSVTRIGAYAFFWCTTLTDLEIPDSVVSIGDSAFSCCKGLTDITIPNSVTEMGKSVFYGCSSLASVTIPFAGNVKEGSENVHFGYIFGAASVSENKKYIPPTLTAVVLTGDADIGASAFSGCSRLTSIAISGQVTRIGRSAFAGCSGLTDLTISNTVTTIGEKAFSGCSALTSITIPNSVTSIGSSTFSYCTGLTSITVADENSVYHSDGNCLIETERKTLIAGCKNSVIPTDGSVTRIGDYAFSGCESLTSITIPNGVTAIGESSFSGCSALADITFPGRKDQWNAVVKKDGWKDKTADFTIHCTDGDITVVKENM